MAATQPNRIATLDIVRGVAVMGILAMNIVAFADVPAAYVNPLAGTMPERPVDLFVYAVNFVLVDGKMRGLFSFLFGASLLIIADAAERAGENEARTVARRQLWLLFFGCLHFYLIWYGDILIGYALIGLAAFLFRKKSVKALVWIGVALVAVQFLIFLLVTFSAAGLAAEVAGPNPSRQALEAWDGMTRDMAVPTAERLKETLALYQGPWLGLVEHQFSDKFLFPFVMTFVFGWETLGYMLLGMAALKSGLLTGAWEDRRYLKWATVLLAIAIPAYCLALFQLFRHNFSAPALFGWSFTATVPFRPLMVAAYACLIIVATRGGGWLVDRISAAGRAAFTNYLGTSILMTAIFYGWGLGLFAQLHRATMYLVVLAAWALMLAWSKPWLERYRYGPFEWLWRSLSRWEWQPMRKLCNAPAQAGA